MMRLANDEEYLEIRMHPDYRLIEKLQRDFTFYVIPQKDGGYLPIFLCHLTDIFLNLSYLLCDNQVFYVTDDDFNKLLRGLISRPIFSLLYADLPTSDVVLSGWE